MDRDLVEAARTGDREAYADLIRVRGDRLFALAQRILRDVDRAEDALQEALVIAWRDLPGLRDPDRFDAWLHRLVVRACITEATRERRRVIATFASCRWTSRPPTTTTSSVADRDQLERGFRRPITGATCPARPPPLRGPRAGRDRRDPRHPGRDRPLPSPPCPPRDACCPGCGRPSDRHRRTRLMTRDQDIERVLERWSTPKVRPDAGPTLRVRRSHRPPSAATPRPTDEVCRHEPHSSDRRGRRGDPGRRRRRRRLPDTTVRRWHGAVTDTLRRTIGFGATGLRSPILQVQGRWLFKGDAHVSRVWPAY